MTAHYQVSGFCVGHRVERRGESVWLEGEALARVPSLSFDAEDFPIVEELYKAVMELVKEREQKFADAAAAEEESRS